MGLKEDEARIAIQPMISGWLMVMILIFVATLALGILTELGWTGTVKWSESLYLTIVYIAIVSGSIIAGFRSRRQGWITGMGVAFLSSIFILILAAFTGEKILWSIFLVKLMINCFIGAFGGIIGVNFSHQN